MDSRTVFCVAAVFALGASSLQAQSIWGIDPTNPTLSNTDGPARNTCMVPAGPLLHTIDASPGTGRCQDLIPFPPPKTFMFPWFEPGDVTVDRVNDIVWATDGFTVVGFDKAGVEVGSFIDPLPFPLTGLGYQAPTPLTAAPILWLSDGFHIMAVNPPPTCTFAPPIPASAMFPVTLAGQMCTDIDYDPQANLLFECYATGAIATQLTTGVFGTSFVPALSSCGFGLYFSGLAVDTATCGTLFVTDGTYVARITTLGALVIAPFPTYAPYACWTWAGVGGPTAGLAFDATPIPMCPGCDPNQTVPPLLEAVGEALTPNPTFALKLTSNYATAANVIIAGPCTCNGGKVKCSGCLLCVTPLLVLPAGITNQAGVMSVTIPLPSGYCCAGVDACVQVMLLPPGTACPVTSNSIYVALACP